MKLLVVGSIALDTIETPFGKEENILGGSASYFSLAACMFTDVCAVAVVGSDFPEQHLDLFRSKGISLDGVTREAGSTFRWEGKYGYDLGDPETLGTHLNVFENFKPTLPEKYRDMEYVFLANIDPELQLSVLNQVKNPKLVACDTMNYWIENKPDALKEVITHVDVLMLNDSETRILAGEPRITQAARTVLELGPSVLIVKRGEYGALMFSKEGIFWAPSYPLEEVIDPTGAGDSFAGGFMGYIAGHDISDHSGYKTAVVFGSVIASFTVENFSVRGIAQLKRSEIDKRFTAFLQLSKLD
jgi:sugar/nucleoside kinase (ribokinase family)